MSTTKMGLVAALESMEENLEQALPINDQEALVTKEPLNPDPSNGDIQPIGTVISVEDYEGELILNKQEADCDKLDTEINEAVASASRLERLQEFSQQTQDNQGGMSRQTAEAVSLAVEGIMANVGMPVSEVGFPALENFGGIKSRSEGNTMALESISTNLKKILETIIAALKAMAKKLIEYAKEATTQAGRVKQRSERLRRYAEGVSGVPSEKTFKHEILANRFSVNGIVPPNMVSEANRVLKITNGIFGYASRHTGEEFTKFYMASGAPEATIEDVMDLFVNPDPSSGLKKTTDGQSGLDVYESETLPGEFNATLSVPSGGGNGENHVSILAETGGGVRYSTPGRHVRGDVPVLSVADTITLLQVAESIMDAVLKFEPKFKEFAKSREVLATAASRFGQEIAKSEGEDEKDRLHGMQYGMMAANRVIGQPAVSLVRYLTSYARALNQYAEANLSQYSRKGSEE